jgi:nucleotide-binding universal stress UspA family protein
MKYKKILIAIDDSAASLLAAKAGFELAHQLNSSVAIIFVIDQSKEIGNVDAGILPEAAAIMLKKQASDTINQIMTQYNGTYGVVRFIPEGSPHEEILNTIQSWDADLLVIGTHGRTGLKHLLMGSVAEHIIRHSSIPVMVVPIPRQ